MTANAHFVRRNFAWRIAGITPTESTFNARAAYVHIDPLHVTQEQVATRSFSVTWLGSDEEWQVDGQQITDGLDQRTATHRYMVEVMYRAKGRYADLQDLMLLDRHDIAKALQAPANFVGYDDSNTATDIGLWNRIREDDELNTDNESVWIYRATWRATIFESEI